MLTRSYTPYIFYMFIEILTTIWGVTSADRYFILATSQGHVCRLSRVGPTYFDCRDSGGASPSVIGVVGRDGEGYTVWRTLSFLTPSETHLYQFNTCLGLRHFYFKNSL